MFVTVRTAASDKQRYFKPFDRFPLEILSFTKPAISLLYRFAPGLYKRFAMLNVYTVSFFGHRNLSDMFALENRLMSLLRELILNKEYVEFLVGRDGDFDQLCSSTIRTAIERYDCGNASHILVLPYERADYRDNTDSYEQYYDEIRICAKAAQAYPKAAILERNRQMINQSDLVICGVEHKSGGAYRAVRYAEQQGKIIINLFDDAETEKEKHQ